VDDLFEALHWLFSVIHPAWCIPLAAGFFFLPGLWLRYKVPQMAMLGWLIGFVPAIVSLAAGFAVGRYGNNEQLFSSSISTSIG